MRSTRTPALVKQEEGHAVRMEEFNRGELSVVRQLSFAPALLRQLVQDSGILVALFGRL